MHRNSSYQLDPENLSKKSMTRTRALHTCDIHTVIKYKWSCIIYQQLF